jgi:hypothetical protein
MKNVFGKGMQLQTLSLAPTLGNNDFILPDKYYFLTFLQISKSKLFFSNLNHIVPMY